MVKASDLLFTPHPRSVTTPTGLPGTPRPQDTCNSQPTELRTTIPSTGLSPGPPATQGPPVCVGTPADVLGFRRRREVVRVYGLPRTVLTPSLRPGLLVGRRPQTAGRVPGDAGVTPE